jgi:hypothetical protein
VMGQVEAARARCPESPREVPGCRA